MRAGDVTDTLDTALKASGCDQAPGEGSESHSMMAGSCRSDQSGLKQVKLGATVHCKPPVKTALR